MAKAADGLEVPLEIFEIYLHRDEYHPGEIVTGKVLIMSRRVLQTDGIYIRFYGKGQAKWQKRRAYLCGLQEAEYVHEKKSIFANAFRYAIEKLPEGASAFPFEFELPLGIPQSILELKHIKISYSVEAMIKTADADYQQQKQFRVKGVMNLNGYPELSLAVCKTLRETMYESCWSSGQMLVVQIALKKQGYVAGEQVQIELITKDRIKIVKIPEGVVMQLVQEIELKAATNDTRIRRKILATNHTIRASNEEEQSQNFTFILKIPDNVLVSYDNPGRDFIKVRYSMRMAVEELAFPYKSYHIEIPIKVGSVWIEAQPGPVTILDPVPLSRKKPENPKGCGQTQQVTASIPEIVINSTDDRDTESEAISDEEESSSFHTPHNKPKVKLPPSVLTAMSRATNSVGDSSGSLFKPMEAFGSDVSSTVSEEDGAILS